MFRGRDDQRSMKREGDADDLMMMMMTIVESTPIASLKAISHSEIVPKIE